MTTLVPGDIEVNDTDAVFRGHLAAAGGTFSGTFRADNVDAIDSINIRDGSVTGFYSFNGGGAASKTFVLPAQAEAHLPFIYIPIEMMSLPFSKEDGSTAGYFFHVTALRKQAEVRITVKRNGVIIAQEMPIMNIGTIVAAPYVTTFTTYIPTYKYEIRTFLLADFGANTLISNTYEVSTTLYSAFYETQNNLGSVGPGTATISGHAAIQNSIKVELRKR